MTDAIILSDLHLGSDACQARQLTHFLEGLLHGEMSAARLVLNGDVFDSMDFRRLKKSHWKVLSLLRKLSDRMEIVWVVGNHDGSAEFVSHLLGVQVLDEYQFPSGSSQVLCLHGHVFDEFIVNHPWLTWVADCFYHFLQRIDSSHFYARLAKKRSKVFLRCSRKIQDGAVARAVELGAAVVCCGHTHHVVADPAGPAGYFNSGCWTEKPCHYLTVAGGRVEVHAYAVGESAEPAGQPVAATL
jgi:UDP-2,3-diacylglucosamine pyrophosphatase LpxH